MRHDLLTNDLFIAMKTGQWNPLLSRDMVEERIEQFGQYRYFVIVKEEFKMKPQNKNGSLLGGALFCKLYIYDWLKRKKITEIEVMSVSSKTIKKREVGYIPKIDELDLERDLYEKAKKDIVDALFHRSLKHQ